EDLLLREIKALPEGSDVRLLGHSDTPLLWLRASDIYISASKMEGHPITPLEALSQETLAIVSDIEGHRFLSDTALLFRLPINELFIQEMEQLIISTSLREEIKNGFEYNR